MRRKNALWICFVTFLLFSMATVKVGALHTKIYVDPKSSTIPDVGDVFTIRIILTDVNDLTGFEFELFWNRKLLNVTATSYTVPDPSWTNPLWVPYSPAVPLNNEYNATHGQFVLGCLNLPPIPISGKFKLATLTFKVMTQGSCTLDLRDTKLTDSEGKRIPHDVIDGEVTKSEQPDGTSEPFSLVNVAIVIVVAVFFVAALYYVKKKKL